MALDAIADMGAQNVVITHESGCVGRFREERRVRRFRAFVPRLEAISAVGSGDTLLAGFIAARVEGRSTEEALRNAVAAGAVSTLEVGAGRFEPREVARIAAEVRVEELEPATAGR
jgi:fructose-1-phosphate kinase PfkB-like protein